MSSRSVSWRRLCSDIVSQRIEEALQSVIYIIHQTGPTGFVLKQGENKFKVFLGNVHTCTCSVFKKEKELCVHILWTLLKKFRVPKTNAVIHQLGLIEREIDQVLHGYLIRQSPTNNTTAVTASGSCDQRPIALDDVCPICQNDLLGKPQRLSYCKYGCGKSVHLKCIKMWAEHQKSQGEKIIHCPLCREKFSTFEELRKEVYSKRTQQAPGVVKQSLHYGVSCSQCQVCPISGKCYKCTTCTGPNFFLCHSCFKSNHHSDHLFQFQQYPGALWRAAIRINETTMQHDISQNESSVMQEPSLPQSFINDLQSRELNSNDYELLLQLDQSDAYPSGPATPPAVVSRRSRHYINSFRTEPLDHNHQLLIRRASCLLCLHLFQRGDWIKKLPCNHKFHRDCIDVLLNRGLSTCPVDGKNLFEMSPVRQIQHPQTGTRRTGHIYTGRHDSATSASPLLREPIIDIDMSILGQGLTVRPNESGNYHPFRSPKTITHNIRGSLTGIRKGSAVQRTSPSIQNTSYISLHVTPLSNYSQQLATETSTDSYRRPNYNTTERWPARSSTTARQVVNGRMIKHPGNESERRILPQIAPNRVEMNSLLQVSSLSTSLPPIT